MFVTYPDFICKTTLYYIDVGNNFKYCDHCYKNIRNVFKKIILRRVYIHETIDKNSASFINEVLTKLCDECNCIDLITANASEDFTRRCEDCLDCEWRIDEALHETINNDILPEHITLVGELREYHIEEHGFIETNL